jgi:8-oxo-dGTP pyrophosphatase MutT (NUDIX family)
MESKETPWECAHREFKEEAGFDVLSVDAALMDEKPFYEHYISFDHDVYETTCWFYTVENKIEVVSPVGDEIEERRWVTTHQARTMLSSSKSAMIEKALGLLFAREHTTTEDLPKEERHTTLSGEQISFETGVWYPRI